MIRLASVIHKAINAQFRAYRASLSKKPCSLASCSECLRCWIVFRRVLALPTRVASGSATTAARAMTGATALVATQKLSCGNATYAVSHACGVAGRLDGSERLHSHPSLPPWAFTHRP